MINIISFLPGTPDEARSDDDCDRNVRIWYGREHLGNYVDDPRDE